VVRLVVAYLAVVVVGLWGRFLIDEMTQETEVSRAVAQAFDAAFGSGLLPVALAAFLLVPGMVVSVELAGRTGLPSAVRRAGMAMVAWVAWGLVLAFIGSELSRIVLLPDLVVSNLGLLAAGGAAFGLLALDGRPIPGRRGLLAAAVVAAAGVILGALAMAGRWGSAV
jgi:hypothetical protein